MTSRSMQATRSDTERQRNGERGERPVTEVISSLTTEVSELVKTQVELAKVEVKDDVKEMKSAAVFGVGAGAVALAGLVLLGAAGAWAIAEFWSAWAGYLVMAALYFVIAAVLGLMARNRFADAANDPVPETTAALQEDATWLRQHKS